MTCEQTSPSVDAEIIRSFTSALRIELDKSFWESSTQLGLNLQVCLEQDFPKTGPVYCVPMTQLLSWLKSSEKELLEYQANHKTSFQVWIARDDWNWGSEFTPTKNQAVYGWQDEPTQFAEMTVAPGSVVLKLLPPFSATLTKTWLSHVLSLGGVGPGKLGQSLISMFSSSMAAAPIAPNGSSLTSGSDGTP